MESIEAATKKPHAVCIPYPAQGHINPMLKLTKLLHTKGFHITFVNTEYNHKRLLKSRGHNSLDGLPNFRFETIPDGLSDDGDVADSTQDIIALCLSTSKSCLVPFRNLIHKLNDTSTSNVPPVTCIISDSSMTFTVEAAQEFGIPVVMFCTTSACGSLGYMQFPELLRRGIIPLKDASYITNGYLDTTMDWISGMRNIRLKDLPSFIRTTESNNVILDYIISAIDRRLKASALIFNTFDALEQDALNALSTMLPPLYTVGPLQLLLDTQISDNDISGVMNMGSNLWKEQGGCVEWLDSQESNSVVYVNFGSITVLTRSQLDEFAWGLANSKTPFLWVIRPDLVVGDSAILPPEFVVETKGRGMLTSWCPQEQVLNHPSTGVFLTHCGWNSTLESLVGGVPIICWPFFAEQHINCRYSCTENEWGIGVEIDNDVKRGEVEELLREVMKGEMGVEMKRKVVQWKKMAEEATRPGGSSYQNLEKLISKVLLYKGD